VLPTKIERLAAVVLCAVALAGCTRTGASAGGPASGHAWVRHGSLRVGEPDEPDSLNPLFAHDAAAQDVAALLFAPVFRYDARGELTPELATTIPTRANGGISADGKTIVLRWRPGVRWADGAPLTTRDLCFTYRAVMNDRNNVASRDGWDRIAAMNCADPLRAVVRLRAPLASILGIFAGGGSAYPPLPEHLLGRLPDLNRAPFNAMPLASGPFRLRRWDRGATLAFDANDRYWRGAPRLRSLTWRVVPNVDTLVAQLRTHEVDVVPAVGDDQARAVAGLDGVAVATHLVANERHLDMNLRAPLLRDVRVRTAIAEAVDWDRLHRVVYHGIHVRASSDIPPVSWAAPKVPFYPYDPAAANRLLDAAGYRLGANGLRARNGAPLRLAISTGTNKPANVRAEIAMQQELRAVGIELVVKNYPVATLFAQDGPLYGGRYDLAWSMDTFGPDPDDRALWNGAYAPPHGADTTFLNDPEVNRLSEAAAHIYERPARARLYQAEALRIHALAPSVFLYWQNELDAFDADFRGFRPAPYGTNFWNAWEWSI